MFKLTINDDFLQWVYFIKCNVSFIFLHCLVNFIISLLNNSNVFVPCVFHFITLQQSASHHIDQTKKKRTSNLSQLKLGKQIVDDNACSKELRMHDSPTAEKYKNVLLTLTKGYFTTKISIYFSLKDNLRLRILSNFLSTKVISSHQTWLKSYKSNIFAIIWLEIKIDGSFLDQTMRL